VNFIARAIEKACVDKGNPVAHRVDTGGEVGGCAALFIHDANFDRVARQSQQILNRIEQIIGEGAFFGADGGEDGAQPATAEVVLVINEVIDPPPPISDESLQLRFGRDFSSIAGDKLDSGNVALAGALLSANPNWTVVVETQPQHGTVSIDPGGNFVYEHDGGSVLQDSFAYRVTNEDGVSAVASVSIVIEPPIAPAFEVPTLEVREPEEESVEEEEEEVVTETTAQKDSLPLGAEFDNQASADSDSEQQAERNTVLVPPVTYAVANVMDILEVIQNKKVSYEGAGTQDIDMSEVGVSILSETELVSYYDIASNKSFVDALNQLDQDLQRFEDAGKRRFVLDEESTQFISIGTTAGVIAWVLRGGALFATALASTPLWASIDPIAVLSGKRKAEPDSEHQVEAYFEK